MATLQSSAGDTHTRLTALFRGLPGWAGTRKVKPVWILLKQETVSGSGISWAICKSAPRSRQITTPAPHHSVFYRPDALPAAQPTASKHCIPSLQLWIHYINCGPLSQCYCIANSVATECCWWILTACLLSLLQKKILLSVSSMSVKLLWQPFKWLLGYEYCVMCYCDK